MISKFRLLFFALALQACAFCSEPVAICVDSQKDYELLDQFFKMGLLEEEYGYVLEGVKPISIRNFYPLDGFPVPKDPQLAEKEFIKTLLVQEAVPVWNKLCSQQKNFVLKAVISRSPGLTEPLWEIQFINVSKLREVIDGNIDLFRYVLGPGIDVQHLVDRITRSRNMLADILQNDHVLIGIVLGFGSHNSVVGGRSEKISSLSISRDSFPFSPKSRLIQSKGNRGSCQAYGGYYLDMNGGADDSLFRHDFSLLQPSSGFLSIEEEERALEEMSEPFPSQLWDKPGFVFGAFKGGPTNEPFFERLKQAQKQTRLLLKQSNLLERVLEKIGGEKPLITCDKTSSCWSPFSLFTGNAGLEEWSRILWSVANRFDSEEGQDAFFKAFRHPTKHTRKAPAFFASKATFEGLKKALRNLAAANEKFENLSKDESLQAVVSKRLYFKTSLPGLGKELKGAGLVRVGYIVEDPEGGILFANSDTWLHLSQLVPGFAHGIQGMHVGEKRTLFIHPALGYGALTTLPPCIGLTIQVHLLDIEEGASEILADLTPLSLDWIQDPEFYRNIEESIVQQPYFVGSFYRDLLDKMKGLDKDALVSQLSKRVVEAKKIP